MIQGETKSGFKFEIDERILEDWSLVLLVKKYDNVKSDIEKTDIIPDLFNVLLGKGGFDKYEKYVRKNNDGFFPIPQIQADLFDILSSNKLKNS